VCDRDDLGDMLRDRFDVVAVEGSRSSAPGRDQFDFSRDDGSEV
jgi:hypothetical protein